MDSGLRDVKFWKLFKNVQHAVRITPSLGFSYLWIDLVCITQNSKEDGRRKPRKWEMYMLKLSAQSLPLDLPRARAVASTRGKLLAYFLAR